MIDIPVTFAILLEIPWFHPLGGVPSIVHQKIKFSHKRKVITIYAETEAIVAALILAPNEIPVSLSFEVCMIYEDELHSKIVSMMKSMNFMPIMGLGKNQHGPSKFVKPKVPILRYGLGYQKIEKSKVKGKKKKALWDTFVEEGANYPYTDNPKPLMIADKLVLGFEIFVEQVKEIKEPTVEKPIVEELVHTPELEEDIPVVKLKDAADQEEELNF